MSNAVLDENVDIHLIRSYLAISGSVDDSTGCFKT